jgi:phenylpropionate dioxygenase-like ring-hydroxylating dioxygenase large terminal subunit
MEHSTQVSLINRVLEFIANNTTDMAERTFRCPTADYYSPDQLEAEKKILFRHYPLVVAHSSELSVAGDFLTCDLNDMPVLLVRSNEGVVKAFINVCRHRGTRLVADVCGSERKAFVCSYHGWTYDQNGSLIQIPDEMGFPDMNRRECGLVRLPVTEQYGFVWVIPTPGKEIDIDLYLGRLALDFDSFALNTHLVYRPYTLRKALNWKLAIDIFLETYHFKQVHAKTIYPMFINNVGVFERFYPHLRNLFPKRTIATLAGTDPSRWNLREHANILYYIFPNTLALVEADHVSVSRLFPDGTDHTRIFVSTLIPAQALDEKARAHWDKNIEILFAATEEDFARGELIQQSIRSGANERLTFGRFEQSLAYFHAAIDSALGKSL